MFLLYQTKSHTSNDGGGIYAKDATTTVNIQNGIISNNFAYDDGGGICTDSGSEY